MKFPVFLHFSSSSSFFIIFFLISLTTRLLTSNYTLPLTGVFAPRYLKLSTSPVFHHSITRMFFYLSHSTLHFLIVPFIQPQLPPITNCTEFGHQLVQLEFCIDKQSYIICQQHLIQFPFFICLRLCNSQYNSIIDLYQDNK